MTSMRSPATRLSPFILAAAVGLSAASSAQQFQEQTGAIPVAARWTEGVECSDVDNDGDLDIFFADGDGFSSAGTKRQNVLIINQLEVMAGMYSDESVARLGSHQSNAKMVITGDIQSDGYEDALFCNGFNTDLPFLYVNQGSSNPGFFDFDGAARGFTTAYSSASGQFGDLDNDGDLDVILCDSGSNFLTNPGGTPHLYFNDGTGNFTEDAVALGAATKRAHMDVQLVDIDNDWDLDFFGACRSGNSGGKHYLMLNDGDGNFTDVSSLPATTSNNVYEAEVGDLDGDTDLDLFFTSSTGFEEGHQRNNLVGLGTLTFTKGTTFSGDDDNEVVFYDTDNDNDLDVIIGSLGSREKYFRNDGGLNWTVANGTIEAVNDRTLDATVADLDNDGDYDLITAQGESSPASWANKVYENTGAADLVRPTILREEALTSPTRGGPWVVRAHMQDQVVDDGKTWVTAEVDYVVLTSPQTANVTMSGLNFVPANINVAAGTTVTWDNPTVTLHTVTSTQPEYGWNSGDMLQSDTFSHTFVRPGVYLYHCIPHQGLGMVGTVTVTGTSANEPATYSGGGIYRFEMPDTAGGAGIQLAYELRFTDAAGNVKVTNSVLANVNECGWSQYDVGASPANSIDLDGSGSTSLGGTFNADATNVVAAGVFFGVSLAPDNYALLGGVGLIDPFQVLLLLAKGAGGGTATLSVNIPNDGSLIGLPTYWQVSGLTSIVPEVWEHSNGLEMIVCP